MEPLVLFVRDEIAIPNIGEHKYKSLKRPLFVVATDLLKGSEKVFYEGELIKPLLASAALPPVFSPVTIDDVLYADGGIMNNFPKEYVHHITDYTIGSNVSITVPLEKKDLRNSFQLTARVTSLMIHASNHEKMMECDLFIEPSELETIGVLDKKGIENAFNIGYEHGSRALEKLLTKT
ncbi:MAG: hypothetical protein CMI56_00370 [Parcubacteria group bacterium]|nr:hypothetical protein [Parcubacteria group bacterium]